MKTSLFISLFIICVFSGFGQFGEQQIISTSTIKPYLSIPVDIDNDGFIDILTASNENHKLSWYRNLDGAGNFGEEIIIAGANGYFLSVYFVDINGDGHKDILYHKNNPSQVAWMENLDGNGNFGAEQVLIDLHPRSIKQLIVDDIDSDGDNDLIIITSTNQTGQVSWFENLDGLGTFSEEKVLLSEGNGFVKMLLEDIDNDGYLDILATDFVLNQGKIFWFKNMGNTTYGSATVIHQFDYVQSGGTTIVDFRYVDINTDGKKDLVITADEESGVITYWLENLDNQGSFDQLLYLANTDYSYLFMDLDNDNDVDLLI